MAMCPIIKLEFAKDIKTALACYVCKIIQYIKCVIVIEGETMRIKLKKELGLSLWELDEVDSGEAV